MAKGFPSERVSSPEVSEKLANFLVDGLLEFFAPYQWVADVEILPYEGKVSYDRALFLIRSVLNIIKLMLGRQYTDRLRTAEDRGHAKKSALLSRTADGKPHISITGTPNDNVR